MKTVSEKIFDLLHEKDMTQKEFALRTGIAESSISDWKRKKTNPTAEKILIICDVLDITPYELLSGAECVGSRSRKKDLFVIDKETELGRVVEAYQSLSSDKQKMVVGYIEALNALKG